MTNKQKYLLIVSVVVCSLLFLLPTIYQRYWGWKPNLFLEGGGAVRMVDNDYIPMDEVRKLISTTVLDPYSAQIVITDAFQLKQQKDGKDYTTTTLCGSINAKNLMGAYTGRQALAVRVHPNVNDVEVFVVDSRWAHLECVDAMLRYIKK